jgi:UDP-N-acetylmuramoyl-L-alanyl-D-glutamate--2,6-diaminopimelate ligase
VLTSDNPRSERPALILDQIEAGLSGATVPAVVERIEDRAAAIRHALRQAAPEDVVLIAGKGHEDYQEAAGVRAPFSDVEQARAALEQRP